MNKLLISVLILLVSCEFPSQERFKPPTLNLSNINIEYSIPVPLQATKFNYPVGPPDAKGYYNAQKFGKNFHLGDDWNSVKGGNNDLGDPVYTIANGYVTNAANFGGGWGNVIRIIYYLPDGNTVEGLYAHCDTMLVKEKTWVDIGDQIGTIGDAFGRYPAHLHFEIRDKLHMSLGGGYSRETEGYIDPTEFIEAHRSL
jgi:murein DD-endopeptidase MepM/ murein hydrolase activator NlpD